MFSQSRFTRWIKAGRKSPLLNKAPTVAIQQFNISTVNLRNTNEFVSHIRIMRSVGKISHLAPFSTLPSHKIVPMPSLSPTMESGSIAKWNVKEGDRFEPGVSLCDVETDKATVSFDATDEGYLAKILVGSGDIKVGQPLIVTVDEASDVAAFKDFKLEGLTVSSGVPKSPPPAAPSVASIAAPAATNVQSTTTTESHSKIFASPLARKLIRESNTSLQLVQQAIGGHGSGPRGRITADDVLKAATLPKPVAVVPTTTPTAATVDTTTSSQGATKASPSVTKSTISTAGVYTDFQVNEISKQLAAQYVHAKQSVPHYYVSVEINVGELLKLRQRFNSNLSKDKKGAKAANDDASNGLSVLDFLVKAAAVATQQIPDINATWMDTFVRRYEKVDINIVMGGGSFVAAPVLKDVGARGLSSISDELTSLQSVIFGEDTAKIQSLLSDDVKLASGTFSIHNLGVYGIKSAAPIILPSQSGALGLGAIIDTVVPRTKPSDGESDWEVAPIMVATLSVDHRVVDGAVAAQWLSAFKQLAENPINLLL